jgi:hypothetical protein
VEYHTYNLLFWGDALTTLCLALIILVGIRETLHLAHDEASTHDAEAATASTAGQPGRGFASVLRDRPFMVFCGGHVAAGDDLHAGHVHPASLPAWIGNQ